MGLRSTCAGMKIIEALFCMHERPVSHPEKTPRPDRVRQGEGGGPLRPPGEGPYSARAARDSKDFCSSLRYVSGVQTACTGEQPGNFGTARFTRITRVVILRRDVRALASCLGLETLVPGPCFR